MDNVAAFYYQDRAVRAAATWGAATTPPLAAAAAAVGVAGKLGAQQGGGSVTPTPPLPTLHRVHAAIATLLRRLCTESRCGFVCSKYTAGAGGGGGGTGGTGGAGGTGGVGDAAAAGKEFMPAQWQAVVTHRCAQYRVWAFVWGSYIAIHPFRSLLCLRACPGPPPYPCPSLLPCPAHALRYQAAVIKALCREACGRRARCHSSASSMAASGVDIECGR